MSRPNREEWEIIDEDTMIYWPNKCATRMICTDQTMALNLWPDLNKIFKDGVKETNS